MGSAFKTLRSNLILQSFALVLAGVVLLVIPNVTMMTIVYVGAFLLTIIGAWALISYLRSTKENGSSYQGDGQKPTATLVSGIMLLVLPLVMFIIPDFFVTIISLLAGALLLISGFVNIMRSIKLRRTGDGSWAASLAISIIIALAGVLLIYDPFASATLFVRILGICLVVNGLADLLIIFWSRNLDEVR